MLAATKSEQYWQKAKRQPMWRRAWESYRDHYSVILYRDRYKQCHTFRLTGHHIQCWHSSTTHSNAVTRSHHHLYFLNQTNKRENGRIPELEHRLPFDAVNIPSPTVTESGVALGLSSGAGATWCEAAVMECWFRATEAVLLRPSCSGCCSAKKKKFDQKKEQYKHRATPCVNGEKRKLT